MSELVIALRDINVRYADGATKTIPRNTVLEWDSSLPQDAREHFGDMAPPEFAFAIRELSETGTLLRTRSYEQRDLDPYPVVDTLVWRDFWRDRISRAGEAVRDIYITEVAPNSFHVDLTLERAATVIDEIVSFMPDGGEIATVHRRYAEAGQPGADAATVIVLVPDSRPEATDAGRDVNQGAGVPLPVPVAIESVPDAPKQTITFSRNPDGSLKSATVEDAA
jgi:hypothetical protein